MFESFKNACRWLISPKTQIKIWGAVIVALAVAWFTHWFGPRKQTVHGVPMLNDLAVVKALSADDDNPTTDSVSSKPSLDISKLIAASRIRFTDWQQLIKASQDSESRRRLVENYRGETVVWEGVFDGISRIAAENGGTPAQQYLLVMYEAESVRTSSNLGRAPALCMLPEAAGAVLSDLEPGQKIVVQGTLAAPETLHGTLLGTRLYNCEVLLR